LGNLITLGRTKMMDGGSFLPLSIIEVVRYGKFGANDDRTTPSARVLLQRLGSVAGHLRDGPVHLSSGDLK
jgi:hypothetical protein